MTALIKNNKVMTNKQGSMPGGIAESPTTAESLGSTRRAIGSSELSQIESRAARWGTANKPSDAKTRAQAKQRPVAQVVRKRTYLDPTTKGQMSRTNSSEGQTSSPVVGETDTGEGLDRPVAGGDRPKEADASSVNRDVGDSKSLDRLNKGGGQGTFDRSVETGGDQDSGVRQEAQGPLSKDNTVRSIEAQSTSQIVHNTTELSTPAINTSDASTNEIEGILKTVDDPEDPISMTMEGSPHHSEGPPELRVITQAVVKPQQAEEAVLSPPKPSKPVAKTDRVDREKPPRREFLKPKITGPPEWMKFEEPERVLYCRRFPESEIRSEIIRPEPLSTTRKVVMGRGMMYRNLEETIQYWMDQTRVSRKTVQNDTQNSEAKQSNEGIVHVGAMSARDADINSDVVTPRRNRTVVGTSHDIMTNKFSAITSSNKLREAENRPMSKVSLSFKGNPNAPDGMTGLSSMRALESRAIQEEERAWRKKEKSIARAPSVSTRLDIDPIQEMLSNDPERYRSSHPPYDWHIEGEEPKGEGSKPPDPDPGNPRGNEVPDWDKKSQKSRGSGYPSDSNDPSDPGSPGGYYRPR